MYFGDALRVLRRRWYILLAGLVIIGGMVGLVIKNVATEYQASGQLLLVLPLNQEGGEVPTNPFLNLPSGLTTAATLVATTVSSTDVRNELRAAGLTSEYSVAVNPGTGPLLIIQAADTDPAEAVATRNGVMNRLDSELARLQGDIAVPESQVIHARANNVSANADALPGSKIRALAAVGAVGLTVTLAITFLTDRLLRSLSRRRVRSRRHTAALPGRPDSGSRSRRQHKAGELLPVASSADWARPTGESATAVTRR